MKLRAWGVGGFGFGVEDEELRPRMKNQMNRWKMKCNRLCVVASIGA